MVKRELQPVRVALTGGNLRQLQKGNATLLKHAQLDESKGTVTLYLRPRVANKLHRAFTKNKGVKLQMVPEEFGKSFVEGGAVATKSTKKRKITYEKDVKPVLGPVLKQATKAAIPVLAGITTGLVAPEFAPLAAAAASSVAEKGATWLGKETGGWGVGDVENLRHIPASHGLNFVDPNSPAFHPGPGLKGNDVVQKISGGSFKPAGGYGIHPAMNPTRDHSDLRNMRM